VESPRLTEDPEPWPDSEPWQLCAEASAGE
jgi:hypothetical protein